MAIRKFLDWKNWLIGLWSKSAEALSTTFLTLVGTNAAESLGVSHVGLTWKGALVQFGIHVGTAAALYVKAKPLPDTITEEFQTTEIKKDQ